MNFTQRLRILFHQSPNASCLCSGKILRDHTPGSKDDRIFIVRFLGCRSPFHRLEMGLPIRMIESIALVQTRSAGMIWRSARPENTFLAINTLPGNTVVVAYAAF